MEPKPGDKVKVVTKDEEVVGALMPNEETNSVVIKLDSGYNLGIDDKKIKDIQVLERFKKIGKKDQKEIKPDKNKPTIAILHTGGTIASKVDYQTGGVTAHFTEKDLLEMAPEIKRLANVKTELVANMMTEDNRFKDYQKLSKTVKKHADSGVKGIIIGSGTDTLTYTSAMLSFMFEELSCPVLVVGSQRSTDRGSTDGVMNLICAAKFMVDTDFKGVATCLHNSSDDNSCAIINGTKARKMHTSRRDAFKPINDLPIALVDYNKDQITYLKKDYYKEGKKTILKDKLDEDVGLLKIHTNMKPELWEFYFKTYKAVVLEATGLGHAPTNLGDEHLKIYDSLKKYLEKGGIVAVTSQCLYGKVHPKVYVNLRRLSNIGCIFCEDMMPEVAYLKLSWLLANYPKEKVKELLPKNLRGEINERLKLDEDFLN